jgi:hypothetical protein
LNTLANKVIQSGWVKPIIPNMVIQLNEAELPLGVPLEDIEMALAMIVVATLCGWLLSKLVLLVIYVIETIVITPYNFLNYYYRKVFFGGVPSRIQPDKIDQWHATNTVLSESVETAETQCRSDVSNKAKCAKRVEVILSLVLKATLWGEKDNRLVNSDQKTTIDSRKGFVTSMKEDEIKFSKNLLTRKKATEELNQHLEDRTHTKTSMEIIAQLSQDIEDVSKANGVFNKNYLHFRLWYQDITRWRTGYMLFIHEAHEAEVAGFISVAEMFAYYNSQIPMPTPWVVK